MIPSQECFDTTGPHASDIKIAKRIKEIEEMEKFEQLVRQYVAPYYVQDYLGYARDYEFEKWIELKVLYYYKLGLTSEDMELKIKLRNERLKKRSEQTNTSEASSVVEPA